MAQAPVDLRSTHKLAIRLYGENWKLKKEMRLCLHIARINLLEDDDDVLEISINKDERKELEAERTPSLPSKVPLRKMKKVRFNDKIEDRVILSRQLWCENCREKGDHTRKDCGFQVYIVNCAGIMGTGRSTAAAI